MGLLKVRFLKKSDIAALMAFYQELGIEKKSLPGMRENTRKIVCGTPPSPIHYIRGLTGVWGALVKNEETGRILGYAEGSYWREGRTKATNIHAVEDNAEEVYGALTDFFIGKLLTGKKHRLFLPMPEQRQDIYKILAPQGFFTLVNEDDEKIGLLLSTSKISPELVMPLKHHFNHMTGIEWDILDRFDHIVPEEANLHNIEGWSLRTAKPVSYPNTVDGCVNRFLGFPPQKPEKLSSEDDYFSINLSLFRVYHLAKGSADMEHCFHESKSRQKPDVTDEELEEITLKLR